MYTYSFGRHCMTAFKCKNYNVLKLSNNITSFFSKNTLSKMASCKLELLHSIFCYIKRHYMLYASTIKNLYKVWNQEWQLQSTIGCCLLIVGFLIIISNGVMYNVRDDKMRPVVFYIYILFLMLTIVYLLSLMFLLLFS